ncbi:MAG: histidinol-phosphatase HisJ family protein [Halanaerobium sp.]
MLVDYHLHSHFSADSEMTMDQLCQTAVEKGLDEIAITDHHDIDYKDDTIEFLIDKKEYLTEIEKMQLKYKDKLRIKKGIEMGLQSHILDQCKSYLADDFDFVIGSFHTAEKADLYNGDFFEGYEQWEAYLNYLKTVFEVVKKYNHYSVIGHLDIIRRYGNFKNQPDLMENNQAAELIREILKIIIKKDRGLEVNTSGYRIDGQNPLPSFEILKLYHQLGGKILTIGSDSHNPEKIISKFDYTISRLKKMGFQELTTFSKMQPQFHKI